MSPNYIRNFLLLLILLLFSSFSSNEIKIRKLQEGPGGHENHPEDDKPDGPPDEPKKTDMDKEENRLKNNYEQKMKENLLLKQEIENKLKYIKILFVTGAIMLIIIIIILIRMCIGRKKKNIIPIDIKKAEVKTIKNNDDNSNSIAKSNYNLLNSDLSISNTISISSSYKFQSDLDNNINKDKEKNLEFSKIGEILEEKINDDNKTLTNNPDIYISSKTDKMLYQPYSKEEIYESGNEQKN